MASAWYRLLIPRRIGSRYSGRGATFRFGRRLCHLRRCRIAALLENRPLAALWRARRHRIRAFRPKKLAALPRNRPLSVLHCARRIAPATPPARPATQFAFWHYSAVAGPHFFRDRRRVSGPGAFFRRRSSLFSGTGDVFRALAPFLCRRSSLIFGTGDAFRVLVPFSVAGPYYYQVGVIATGT